MNTGVIKQNSCKLLKFLPKFFIKIKQRMMEIKTIN